MRAKGEEKADNTNNIMSEVIFEDVLVTFDDLLNRYYQS